MSGFIIDFFCVGLDRSFYTKIISNLENKTRERI